MAIQSLLWFQTNFSIVCSSSVKNAVGILIGIVLSLYIALNSTFKKIFYLFIHERQTEKERERERERERGRLYAGSLTWDSIPGSPGSCPGLTAVLNH